MRAGQDHFWILLVENDPDDLLLFKKSLQSSPQFPSKIDSARSIEEAIEKLKAKKYDLLLAESQFHNGKGIDLFQEMQANKIQIPFVLMTPIRDDSLAREAIKLGVAEVLVRNESQFHELAEKLRQSFNRFYSRRATDQGEEAPAEFLEQEASAVDKVMNEPTIRDELTGVFTHGYLHQRIVTEFSRANRYSYPLSCLMVDIDHFKNVNEEQGYHSGDALLRECAQLIFDSCRLSDVVARYGGSQFLVLLPHISYQGALQVSKRLRQAFAEGVFLKKEKDLHVTVSIGVSSYPEDTMTCRSDMINHAQRAMMSAKASGRNRCMLFRDVEPMIAAKIPKLEVAEEVLTKFQRRVSEVAENARRDYIGICRDMVQIMESKDKFTSGHGSVCAKYARHVADVMGLSAEETEIVETGALLHDIGKICIPDSILLKEGKLTFAEFEIMKQHTYFGYRILKPVKFLREEALIALHHHEWFNGEGYPCHLKGEEIPLGARICGVVDAFDTMRQSGGRYKKTSTLKDAVEELLNHAGIQFDPKVVKAFVDVLYKRGELHDSDYDREFIDKRLRASVHKKSA